MASNAIETRLRVTESQLAEFKKHTRALQETAARLEKQISAIRRSLHEGESTSERVPPVVSEPVQPRHASPPPIPRAEPPAKPPSREEPARAALPATAKGPAKSSSAETPITTPIPPSPDEIPPRKEFEGLELAFGRIWFVRIGIGLLLTGFVFLSTYAYQNYIINWSAGARVAALYTAAISLTALGIFLERWKEALRNYGRVVTAGGWAAIYYTTYAAHHIERLRVIDSPVLATVLLSLVGLGFFGYAARKQSSLLSVASLILAFYATAINPMGWLGCFSSLLLSLIGMTFFLRFSWMRTGVTSLVGAYLSYLYWRGFISPDSANDATRWFLVGYWLLFTVGILAPQAARHQERFRVAFASANNIFFFLLFSFQLEAGRWVPTLWINALVFGLVLLGISIGLRLRGNYPPLLCDIFLIKGLSLLTWGLTLELTGHQLFLTLMIEAVALACVSRRNRSSILRTFSWIAAGLAAFLAFASLLPGGEQAPNLAYLTMGLLFMGMAYALRGAPFIDSPTQIFSQEATIASVLGFFIPTVAYGHTHDASVVGMTMMAVGIALWMAYLARFHHWPLPEPVWLGQVYALLGALITLLSTDILWHYGVVIALATIALHAHGITSDRKPDQILRQACRYFEWVFAALALIALAAWIHRGIDSASTVLLIVAGLPLLGHLYGSAFSRWTVAFLSQGFHLSTLALSVTAWSVPEPWNPPTQLAAIGALTLVVGHLVSTHALPLLKSPVLFRDTHLVLAAVLWSGWCMAFIEPWWLVLAWTGFLLFNIPQRFQARAFSATCLTLLTIGTASACLTDSDSFWLRYLTLPAAFLVHLFHTSRAPDKEASNQYFQWTILAILLVATLAVITSQHTLELFNGRGLAICWALLGMALFGLGIGVRVRVYRLGGLALVALSLGHILLIDVWKLGTVLRILSFLTLGLVLLALGFVYNRWHEALRKLL